MPAYRISLGALAIEAGVAAPATSASADIGGDEAQGWALPLRPLSAAEVVAHTDRLLQAVLASLGAAADRDVLLDGLAAVLAVEGRESALPAAHLLGEHDQRGALGRQAQAIGSAILELARNPTGTSQDGGNSAELEIRSPCEGHVWTDKAAALLMGPSGGPRAMQLYNEWQHQLLLLRDALLPFINWRDVPVALDRLGVGGLRRIENHRKQLITAILTGRTPHELVVAHALALFGGAADAPAYGFQTGSGMALPALTTAGRGLLEWHRAHLVSGRAEPIPFHYEDVSYYDATRVLIGDSRGFAASVGAEAARLRAAGDGESATLTLEVDVAGRSYTVPMGRIARGLRFSIGGDEPLALVSGGDRTLHWHDARTILDAPGLVSADDGVHAIPADPLVTLALLGCIYPENVVLAAGESIDRLSRRGKGFGPLFIVGDIAAAGRTR